MVYAFLVSIAYCRPCVSDRDFVSCWLEKQEKVICTPSMRRLMTAPF
jgi:hypothetical protein